MNKTSQWLTVGLMLLATGCQSGKKANNNQHPSAPKKPIAVALSAEDFVQGEGEISNAPTDTHGTVITQPATTQPATTQPATSSQASRLNASKTIAATYHVAGMVGQVNGRPIYAQNIFKDVHERLTDLGQRLPRNKFHQQASTLLQGRLQQIVMDALILGEAEKQLSQANNTGILNFLKEERKKLIRELGRGSEELANERSRTTSGLSLDQRISERRNQIIVQSYLKEKLWPKINVSRKDIERYYHDHFEDFNPPQTRTIHMIRTRNDNVANQIDKELTRGRSFLDIAGDNVLNPRDWEKKGLFGKDIKGNPFGNDALNQATLTLGVGQYTPRMKVGSMHTWVYIDSVTQDQAHSLREVQLEIERILKQQQYNNYTEQYQKRLLDEGSYNDMQVMHKRLMDICMSIYVAQQ